MAAAAPAGRTTTEGIIPLYTPHRRPWPFSPGREPFAARPVPRIKLQTINTPPALVYNLGVSYVLSCTDISPRSVCCPSPLTPQSHYLRQNGFIKTSKERPPSSSRYDRVIRLFVFRVPCARLQTLYYTCFIYLL